MDDVNVKHTFLNSLPEPLVDETLRMMNLQRITLQQASLGEIYQHVLIALEKLCNQRKFLSEIDKVHSKLKDNCRRKDLQIKCYEKNCACPQKKDIISKNILERKDVMWEKRKTISERRNGSFSEGSSLKEKPRKLALYAGDQAILQEIARKRRKQQSSLNISFSLLYLVLCSIPHFHVVSYMLLVIYLINQFP